MYKYKVVILSTFLLALSSGSAYPVSQEEALNIAKATGCAILSRWLVEPNARIEGTALCVWGTLVARDLVASAIDEHFAGEDQAFANKYCLTIDRGDGNKIVPTDKANCDK